MGKRRRCLRHVDAICQRYRLRGMTPDAEFDFRDYLHQCKDAGDGGSDGGDFTEAELDELARDFLGLDAS